jgi:hypothetical protein
MPCAAPTDCPDPGNECLDRTCNLGQCGTAAKAAGTPTTAQTPGDCQQKQCDGAGAITSANSAADLPVDGNDCTDDVCTAGAPSNPLKAVNTACGAGGGLKCNSTGQCVGCVVVADCAGQDTDCQARTCTMGACGTLNAPLGKLTTAQTAGDCEANQCDGNGAVVKVADNADVPVDSKACTKDVCAVGAPSNPPQPAGTACVEGGGIQCDGAGKCVTCLVAADCPGQDTECQQRACTAGVCGTAFAALGKPLAVQTPSDCKKLVCDGSGGTTQQNDDADLPGDSNACTTDICTAGVPSHANAANGASCGAGTVCLNGACTGCSMPTDCPGVDDECKTRTCAAGTCGQSFTATGTAVTMQTAGDCAKKQCDGAGNTVSVADNADVPADDGNQCTSELCTAGVPSHPALPVNTACAQAGGSFCSATGACVACNAATQCAGTDTECHARTCTLNTCGVSNAPAGTTTAAQTAGDCKSNECDGAGAIVAVNAGSDVPADDGNQCTSEVCTAGVPSHPANPVNTACSQNGGSFCSAASACVQCNAATQCAGTDTECHARTCTANACGVSNAPAGTATTAQTAGDCKKNQCDGAGSIVPATDNTDVPADDGVQCLGETCVAGAPMHPALPLGTPCTQAGGTACDGNGLCVAPSCSDGVKNGTETAVDCGGTCLPCALTQACLVNADCASAACAGNVCVECLTASQCAGTDTECHARTCTANACGVNNVAAGTATAAQTANDCQKNQCDGAGNIAAVADNTDAPLDDGNQCTSDVCAAGAPVHPTLPQGTACNQNGGTICDAATAMCIAVPQVASTTPGDATTPVAAPAIAVTFTVAMNPATLTGQTAAGACSGSIQVSLDNFASCIAFSAALATPSGGNTTATLTATPGLLVNRVYNIRVTTAATSALGVALASTFTTAMGFTTTSPNLCDGSVVMSQVYGGGGTATASYKFDFVELHNRGTTAASLANTSVQYASATGTSWNVALLSGTIPAGGYFLVQLGGNSGIANLPTPDVIPTNAINMSGTAGKIAFVNSTTAIPTGSACPPAATLLDFVGFGTTANCSEGSVVASAPSTTTSLFRNQAGCGDVNVNGTDLTIAAPAPRNSATAAAACACVARNESNAALEADFVTVQSPLTLSAAAGAMTAVVYGRIYELGTTEAAGANGNVRAQLGYGLPTANPEYEAGWTWTNATYNAGFVDPSNDEYQATFTAPVSGSYRYVYRFSLDQGVSWTYADATSGDGGAGSNGTLTFDFASENVLTVP